MNNQETISLSFLLNRVEQDLRKDIKTIKFSKTESSMWVQVFGDFKSRRSITIAHPRNLPSSNQIYIDDLDGDVFLNLELIEFVDFEFENIEFIDSRCGKGQNVLLSTRSFEGRNNSNDVSSQKDVLKTKLKYPILKFFECGFKSFNIRGKEIYYGIKFIDCEFLDDMQLDGCVFDETIYFEGLELKHTNNNQFFPSKINFKKDFVLKRVSIEKDFYLNSCKFEKGIKFENVKVDGVFSLNPGSESAYRSGVFNEQIIFEKVEFNKFFDISECSFGEKVVFKDVIFKEKVGFGRTKFKRNVEFKNTTFEKEFEISKDTFVEDKLAFEKINFGLFKCDDKEFFKIKELEFKDCEFQQIHEFKDLEFKKISFNTCRFNDNVYFNNSIFKGYTDFHESQFEKIACFYGVNFNEVPNFSQAIFKGSLNLVNTNLNFGFEHLETKIENESGKYEENSNNENQEIKKKTLDQFANDFRDSFRLFKNALIKDNNLLDASNYHKFELYAKEIELKEHWNQRSYTTNNGKDIKAISLVAKNMIDLLHLNFYRKLCDHHTDLLRIINNLVLLIALFVLFNYFFALKEFSDNVICVPPIIESIYSFINERLHQKPFVPILVCIASSLLLVCVLYLLDSICNFIKDIIFLLMAVISVVILEFFILICVPKDIKAFAINTTFSFLFVAIYIWLVYIKTYVLRFVLLCIGYIVVLIGIGFDISLLNPLIGKILSDDSIKTSCNKQIIIALGFVYNILFIFVLFSLQKTARKNSIVPS